MSICKYCKKNEAIKKSHVLPRFIFDWLKKTSATQAMRCSLNQNQRAQDGIKIDLLCSECELKFSKYENSFKKNVFSKIANYRQQNEIVYLNELDKKCVYSIAWRVLSWAFNYKKMDQFHPDEMDLIPKYLNVLKNATETGQSKEIKTYIIPLTEKIIRKSNLPKVDFMYYDRTIGMEPRIYDNLQRLFLYIKLPFILIVNELILCSEDIWTVPQMEDMSSINPLGDYIIPDYIYAQINYFYSKYLESKGTISPEQIKLIQRDLQKVSTENGTFKTIMKNYLYV